MVPRTLTGGIMAQVPETTQISGETFGKYQLLSRIAVGGMGEVFLATLRGLEGFEKQVVVKRILPHLNSERRFVAMFLDEARLAAQISHPNVCHIYELGEVDGQYYMAMEFLDGVPLSRIIRRRKEYPQLIELPFLGGILAQVCEGLHAAHELRDGADQLVGVVHRDVCHSNIVVTVSGAAKLLDFGVAKARGALHKTRTGAVKGTYAYMAPEQLRADDLDRRADIFSLGVVAWEALTGRRLFKRDSDYKTFQAITNEPIPRVSEIRGDMPTEIAELVARCLARNREDRPETAREVGQRLRSLVEATAPLADPSRIGSLIAGCFSDELAELRARFAPVSPVATRTSAPARLPAHDDDDDDDDFPAQEPTAPRPAAGSSTSSLGIPPNEVRPPVRAVGVAKSERTPTLAVFFIFILIAAAAAAGTLLWL